MSSKEEKQKFVNWLKERCEVKVDDFFDFITNYMPETIEYLIGLYFNEREEHLQNWKRRAESADEYIEETDFLTSEFQWKSEKYSGYIVENTQDMTLPKIFSNKDEIYKV